MAKKDEGPQTGKQFLRLAKERGASVEEKGLFHTVETPAGKVKIYPGDERLDAKTIANLRKWFRLLGLMALLLGLYEFWPQIRNIIHIIQNT